MRAALKRSVRRRIGKPHHQAQQQIPPKQRNEIAGLGGGIAGLDQAIGLRARKRPAERGAARIAAKRIEHPRDIRAVSASTAAKR